MAVCELCGSDYDTALEMTFFDCFECAIAALAPTCAHCGCRIIGQGVEVPEGMFCSAHCAKQVAGAGVRDRAA
jgi:hypothetical protein